MNLIKEIFLGREKLFTLNAIIFHGALLAISFAFVYVFSYSTSFGYDLLGGDSAIFQAIGKYWTQGYLPYVDLFDHKGPLIFFINAIGYMIYPRSGIMALQIICLYLSCLFIWRAMELYSSNRWKVFFLLLTLIYYAAHYEKGNHVTEYTLPFLSAAAYCFLLSLKEDKFPPLYGFVYGLGFGACFMIRVSDAAQICCQCFLVAVFLLLARDFKTLWQNILSFLAGFAIICLPFMIYFAAHDALYDMIYGTILFNLKYANDASFHFPLAMQLTYNLIHLLPFVIALIVAALALKDNPKSRLLLSALFIMSLLMILLMKLRPYLHYELIFFPVMPILFAVVQDSSNTLQKIWRAPGLSLKRVLIKISLVLTIIQICTLTFWLKITLLAEENPIFFLFPAYDKRAELLNRNERQNILKLRAVIPDAEKTSFAIWGAWNTGSHWILQTDMVPRERLFMNTSQCAKLDPQLRQEYFGNLCRDYPLWILYGMSPNRKPGEPPSSTEDAEFEQLLAERYSLKGEVYIFPQMMRLYRLKEE